jgi:hypothetical protein
MNGEIVVVDLKHISSVEIFQDMIKQHKDKKIVALSPYSFYVLDNLNLEYETLHNFISKKLFRDRVLNNINLIEKNLKKECQSLMIELTHYVSFIEYEKTIKYIFEMLGNRSVTYITDVNDVEYDLTNNTSIFATFSKIDINWTLIPRQQSQQKNIIRRVKEFSFDRILIRLLNKLFKIEILYDWSNFAWLILKNSVFTSPLNYEEVKKYTCVSIALDNLTIESFYKNHLEVILKKQVNNPSIIQKNKNIFFKTWLSSSKNYLNISNNRAFFYQHGNYFYKNIGLKFTEVYPADVNFVFNDYTKKVFKNLGAKKVHSVGSLNFQKKIKTKQPQYDYLYITQGHDYLGNLQCVDFENSLHSFDGYELYQRHKNIIELFGNKFQDKILLIRVHPLVLNLGVYVPFWELASNFPNIKIDVTTKMHYLIEKSKYIISDYFSSEFINREIHYKRDIILFSGAPTPLPENTMKDLSQMFILVKDIDELSFKIMNIDSISNQRIRIDEIIEYYSSKKCNTKNVVTEILSKEIFDN